MSTVTSWQWLIDECRKQEFPVVITATEPWFAVHYLCANFLMIEKVSDFVRKCKEAQIPLLRVNQKVLIRFSDIERVCLEQSAEDEDGLPDPVSVQRKESDAKPRKGKKA